MKYYAMYADIDSEIAIFDTKEYRDAWVSYLDDDSVNLDIKADDPTSFPRIAVTEDEAAFLTERRIYQPECFYDDEFDKKIKWIDTIHMGDDDTETEKLKKVIEKYNAWPKSYNEVCREKYGEKAVPGTLANEIHKKASHIFDDAVTAVGMNVHAFDAKFEIEEPIDDVIMPSLPCVDKLIDKSIKYSDMLWDELIKSVPVSTPEDSAKELFSKYLYLHMIYIAIKLDDWDNWGLVEDKEETIDKMMAKQKEVIFQAGYGDIFDECDFAGSWDENAVAECIEKCEALGKQV